jgi:hypothetical protein
MPQIAPSSFPLPVKPEHLQSHFDAIMAMVKRIAPLNVGLYEHIFYAVHPEGWAITFGRNRTRVRFRYIPRKGMTVQQADAPPSESYPPWESVSSEPVDWSERQSSEYEAIEKILHERFSA